MALSTGARGLALGARGVGAGRGACTQGEYEAIDPLPSGLPPPSGAATYAFLPLSERPVCFIRSLPAKTSFGEGLFADAVRWGCLYSKLWHGCRENWLGAPKKTRYFFWAQGGHGTSVRGGDFAVAGCSWILGWDDAGVAVPAADSWGAFFVCTLDSDSLRW